MPNLPLYPTYFTDYTTNPNAFNVLIQPAFEEDAGVNGAYNLNFTLVTSSPNGSTTFLTKEDAAAYLYSTSIASFLIDINSVCANYFTTTSFQPTKEPFFKLNNLKVDKITGKGLSTEDYSTVEKTKLSGIATNATANDTDANLKARANHTGTQAAGTITGLATIATTGAYSDLTGKPTIPTIQAYEGTTQRLNAFPIFKSGTVGSGVIALHLTNDGLSTGTALFPNGVIQDSVNVTVSDATASYQMSWAFSNSNKTLTVTANKLTTSNILTGVLGQAQANSSVVKLSVWGY